MAERKTIDYTKELEEHSDLIKRNKIEEAKKEIYSIIISSLKFGQEISEEDALLNWINNRDNIQILVLKAEANNTNDNTHTNT